MRLGKVEINYGYVVDLDDEEMVDHAKESIFQDMFNAYKYDNVESYIGVRECGNGDQGIWIENDIPSFLIEDDVERKEEAGIEDE